MLATVVVAATSSPASAASSSVSITSPTYGATVSGTVSVQASGSTDSSQSDLPSYVDLYVDGVQYDYAYCGSAPSAYSCPVTISWDTTGLTGQHSLQAKLTTDSGATVLGSVVTVTVASPGPTVAIASPTSGATVNGTVSVQATGSTDASQSDLPSYVDLYVDGVEYDYAYCGSAPNPNDCPVTLSWDSTGLTGQHTLQAKITTDTGKTGLSRIVTVTVNSPGPSVSMASPASGSIVSGTVSVQVNGATDTTQSDLPSYVDLYVDGVEYDYAYCGSAPSPNACPASIAWDTTGLSGQHTLQVKLTTDNGNTALGAPATVAVYSGTVVRPHSLSTVTSGNTVSVRGYIRSRANGSGAAGVPVTVTATPAVGSAWTKHTVTASSGYFALSFTVKTNTSFAIKAGATAWYGSSSATARQMVKAVMSCGFATTYAHVGQRDYGRCKVPSLPGGVTARLQEYYSGSWHTFKTLTSTAGRIGWSATPQSVGTSYLRVTAASNRVYAATASKTLKRVIK
jgi:hypothetical protein